jgi:hypothetical protein
MSSTTGRVGVVLQRSLSEGAKFGSTGDLQGQQQQARKDNANNANDDELVLLRNTNELLEQIGMEDKHIPNFQVAHGTRSESKDKDTHSHKGKGEREKGKGERKGGKGKDKRRRQRQRQKTETSTKDKDKDKDFSSSGQQQGNDLHFVLCYAMPLLCCVALCCVVLCPLLCSSGAQKISIVHVCSHF